jgi:hypothetical protein
MSLRRLGLDRIDLYYLHSGTATDAPFADQVGVLAEFKEQGLIRHIGPSNVTVEQFEAAREIVEIAALTANYTSVRDSAPHIPSPPNAQASSSHPEGPPASMAPTPRTSARKSMKSRTATMRRPIRWRSPGCCVARRTPLPSRGRVRPATSTTTTRPAVSCSPLTKSAASPTSPPKAEVVKVPRKSTNHGPAPLATAGAVVVELSLMRRGCGIA